MKKQLFFIAINLLSIVSYAQVSLPYNQDFEGTTFPPAGWQTFPIGSLLNWQRDSTASAYGIGLASSSFDNYNTSAGGYYGIRLPSMNFTSVSNPYVRFDIAYAQRIGTGSDVLGFWWSNNGNSNWQNIINYSGSTLTTAPATANLFVPTAGQWQTKTLSLSTLAGLPFVRLAIEDDCTHGNKIYFDNVIVFDSTGLGINEIYNSNQLIVSPNPTSNELNIQSNSSQPIQFVLYNSLGEKLIDKILTNKTSTINLSAYSNDIYFYRVSNYKQLIKSGEIIKQ